MRDVCPIFILGVPRSGTTLLRTLLDSHPNIACGPEAPWLAGSYGEGVSFKAIYNSLISDHHGPVANFSGVDKQDVAAALGLSINEIFTRYATGKGKIRWVEKTPSHAIDIDFLHVLFPDALYLHIVRDGRDVACSTFNGRAKWGRIVDTDGPLEITRENALERWARWEALIREACDGLNLLMHTLRYEDLIRQPEETLSPALEFMGETYVDSMANYAALEHDFPYWEAGSTDVRSKPGLVDTSLGRWGAEYPAEELKTMSVLVRETLERHGYEI